MNLAAKRLPLGVFWVKWGFFQSGIYRNSHLSCVLFFLRYHFSFLCPHSSVLWELCASKFDCSKLRWSWFSYSSPIDFVTTIAESCILVQNSEDDKESGVSFFRMLFHSISAKHRKRFKKKPSSWQLGRQGTVRFLCPPVERGWLQPQWVIFWCLCPQHILWSGSLSLLKMTAGSRDQLPRCFL